MIDAFLCERCGAVVQPQRASKRTKRCDECSKEPPEARVAPPHAAEHHYRGEWVLRCQAEGCSETFVGYRHARRCPTCRSATVTSSKRVPLRKVLA